MDISRGKYILGLIEHVKLAILKATAVNRIHDSFISTIRIQVRGILIRICVWNVSASKIGTWVLASLLVIIFLLLKVSCNHNILLELWPPHWWSFFYIWSYFLASLNKNVNFGFPTGDHFLQLWNYFLASRK